MANITVSYTELERVAAQLGVERDEITQRIQGLQRLIDGLISSGFVTDQASGKFGQMFHHYSGSASTMIAQLGEIQQYLMQAATAMREMDAQLAARIH